MLSNPPPKPPLKFVIGMRFTITKSSILKLNGRWEVYNISLAGQMIHLARLGASGQRLAPDAHTLVNPTPRMLQTLYDWNNLTIEGGDAP